MNTTIVGDKIVKVRVADEVWIAMVLLHREHPERAEFTIDEIVGRVAQENIYGSLRPGVRAHISSHCVANKDPKPALYRMLYATGKHTRRLYRADDAAHPLRSGKIKPSRDEIPERYHNLLDWYETEYFRRATSEVTEPDPILALRGAGKEIWQDEHPDEYVRRLREGWE